ncbi:MAG: hypothetical protein H8Z69_01685 [Nanohaloarchaea archaeon]|nr:hypothetical protein [Candidatus Nanohaloarchaea archaeon]
MQQLLVENNQEYVETIEDELCFDVDETFRRIEELDIKYGPYGRDETTEDYMSVRIIDTDPDVDGYFQADALELVYEPENFEAFCLRKNVDLEETLEKAKEV